jgi:Icc-related predicted phosphoesterase
MIIDCIGCLHGFRPKLSGGDLLLVTGDLAKRDDPNEYAEFVIWLQSQRYAKKIVIAGNHDNFIQQNPAWSEIFDLGFTYVCDSGTEFEGMKIWGTPWTKTFDDMNPDFKSFTVDTEEELKEKWALIPNKTNILVSHNPPLRIRDRTCDGRNVGSHGLRSKTYESNICLHAFSHIHEDYGHVNAHIRISPKKRIKQCSYINCSLVNERYQPVNAPIRIELSNEDLPKRR